MKLHTEFIAARIPRTMSKQCKEIAETKNLSDSAVVREAVALLIERHEFQVQEADMMKQF